MFSYLTKILTDNNGASFVKSAAIGAIPTMSFGGKINLLFEELINECNLKALVVPAVVSFVLFAFFFLLAMMNMHSGIKGAYYSHKENLGDGNEIKASDYIDNEKLWNTFYKVVAVIMITIVIFVFAAYFSIENISALYWISIWFLFTIWALACGFEFSSIGNNICKRKGGKPEIFTAFDNIFFMFRKANKKKVEDFLGKRTNTIKGDNNGIVGDNNHVTNSYNKEKEDEKK